MSSSEGEPRAALEQRSALLHDALSAFVERVAEDRTVLAVIRLGSGRPETVWNTDSVWCWVVVADGTRARRASDGDEPRIWRTFVEDDIDIHAELIERTKLKRMVEGNDRNTAGFSWFSARTVVHCVDPSIERWFATMQTPGSRDRRHDRLGIACWIAGTLRRTERRLDVEARVDLALGDAFELALAVACLCIVDEGDVVEHRIIDRACTLQPDLMATVYRAVVATPSEATVRAACEAVAAHLSGRAEELMEPVLRFLTKVGTPVPLSELCEHFATSALHPGALSSACEWLVRQGHVTKLSAPIPVTRKSRVRVDEPSYSRT